MNNFEKSYNAFSGFWMSMSNAVQNQSLMHILTEIHNGMELRKAESRPFGDGIPVSWDFIIFMDGTMTVHINEISGSHVTRWTFRTTLKGDAFSVSQTATSWKA